VEWRRFPPAFAASAWQAAKRLQGPVSETLRLKCADDEVSNYRILLQCVEEILILDNLIPQKTFAYSHNEGSLFLDSLFHGGGSR
jgi:hypothetical protein